MGSVTLDSSMGVEFLRVPFLGGMLVIFTVIFYALYAAEVIPMGDIFEIGQAVLVCSFPISAIWAPTETRETPPKRSSITSDVTHVKTDGAVSLHKESIYSRGTQGNRELAKFMNGLKQ
jgi:hypothetical protein